MKHVAPVLTAPVLAAVVLTAVVLGLAGCGGPLPAGPGDPQTSRPTVEPKRELTASGEGSVEEGGRPVAVGVLIGSRLRDVRSGTRGLGLRFEVRRRTSCAAGVVLDQSPAPGTRLERGSTVELVVARTPAAATCIVSPGARAVRHLRAWVRGDAPAPAFADRVRLLVANVPKRSLTGAQARDPARWTIDDAYAERVDVPILGILAAGRMHARDVPPWFCPVKGFALPADLVRRLPWSGTLVTSQQAGQVLTCMEVAAVQVWADGEGRITDVNVLRGSP